MLSQITKYDTKEELDAHLSKLACGEVWELSEGKDFTYPCVVAVCAGPRADNGATHFLELPVGYLPLVIVTAHKDRQ